MKRIDVTKYLDIPYKHLGSSFAGADCLGLCRLFFMTEFNVLLPDPAYDEDWDNQGQNLITEGYSEICEKGNTPERYGMVGFRLPGHYVEHHLGIVLWDCEQFLHSPLNQKSRLEKLSHPVWKRSVTSYYSVKNINNSQLIVNN